ncbi:MAG: hypothetical protein GXO78_08765 [Calditrichaeota bacterium]|nr:hypothetical protein [Calditrichota bacterium]
MSARLRTSIGLLIVLIFCEGLFAQAYRYSLSWWKIISLRGFLQMEGFYRTRESYFRTNRFEEQQSKKLLGEFSIRAKNYIIHPNFLLLDLEGGYQPISQEDKFLVFPDRTETRTAKRYSINMTLLRRAPIRLTGSYRFQHDFINRELLTNVETIRRSKIAGVFIQNPLLPLQLKYYEDKWDQKEIDTGRTFLNYKTTYFAEASRSFKGEDAHVIRYTHEIYDRDYTGFLTISSRIDNLKLNSRIPFKLARPSLYTSSIWYYRQRGFTELDRLLAFQDLNLELKYNFTFNTNYQYSHIKQPNYHSDLNMINASLQHRLYLSLISKAYIRYFAADHIDYRDRVPTAGVSFNYQKKIPTGKLQLEYEYRMRRDERSGEPGLLRIVDEEIVLRDDRTTLLKNPLVDPASVVVTDASGTILYQEGLDYILIPRGEFLEIQRIPGGQIPNGATVLVDYISRLPVSYRYDTQSRFFGAKISLFYNLLELHYSTLKQDHSNIRIETPRILEYIDQMSYGGQINFAFISAGYEYEDYQSNILPYIEKRFFVNLMGTFFSKIDLAVTGNFRDYLLTREQERQTMKDISGKMTYWLGVRTALNFDGGLRIHRGKGLDLDLYSARAEFRTRYRQLTYILGVEFYKRRFIGERADYNGIYLRIRRDF